MEAKKRRLKGEGSIFYREKDDRYVARYKGKTAYAHTRREAIDKLMQLKLAANDPKLNKITMQKAMEKWLKTKAVVLKPTSIDRLEQTVNGHLIPAIGDIFCDEFREDDFVSLVLEPMRRKSLSFSSIKKAQDATCAFCRWASAPARGYMKTDPMGSYERISKVALARANEEESPEEGIIYLDLEQRNQFTTACRSKFTTGKPRFKYGEALIFDMYTGLRMGELLALRWDDIDLEDAKVRVAAEALMVLDRDPNSPSYGRKVLTRTPYTKTNRPRYVPLGEQALKAARNMLAMREGDSPYVLANYKGELVRPSTISAMAEKVYDLANIKLRAGTNIHALRHTYASMCFGAGLPVRIVSELLGHSSVQITMDTYIHLIQGNDVIRRPELESLL